MWIVFAAGSESLLFLRRNPASKRADSSTPETIPKNRGIENPKIVGYDTGGSPMAREETLSVTLCERWRVPLVPVTVTV